MSLRRRTFVISGASLGALALAGCTDTNQQDDAAVTPAPADTPASTGDVAMYDGTPVAPLSGEAIMNPDGIQDRPIGGKDTGVILIEYASPTCPHCATFHNTVYPTLKAEYVDTGKITLIVRPFIRNVQDAVVFMLAEASEGAAYYDVLSTYFETQSQWSLSDKPRDAIQNIALQLGFTEESFEAALTNQGLFDGMEQARTQALEEFNLTGTPTFYLNGNKITGEQSIDAFRAQIDPLLG